MDISIIYTIVIGIFAGFIGAAIGQTGSGFLIPGLLILGVVPNFKIAAGTVLLALLPPVSMLGIFEYYRNKQVYVGTALLLMSSYFFSSYFGAKFAQKISDSHLQYAASTYYFSVGLFFLWNGYTGFYGKK